MGAIHTYLRYAKDLITEWEQCRDEGRDVHVYEARCREISEKAAAHWTPSLEKEAVRIGEEMLAIPVSPDYPYVEPSTLEGIRACCPENAKVYTPASAVPAAIRGAWAGRIAGCLLGKPVEGLRRPALYPLLKACGNYPMHKYIRACEMEPGFDGYNPDRCWADKVDGISPSDDDTNYTTLGMVLLENWGRDFTPDDVMDAWGRYLPAATTCTAERIAYRNALMGLEPPETAYFRNPCREWIGAQIRGDFFGYINPGNPALAAEMAWRDASISHIKNGIYGEMFIAAMLAAAAVTDDIDEIIDAGLAQIPAKSRLRRDVDLVRGWAAEGLDGAAIIEKIHGCYDEMSRHGWCHTNSNAMIVTMALLKGDGDFGKSICLAVQAAFDTDCNGATVGSIIGLRNRGIPAEWEAPFMKGLRTNIDGATVVTLDELVERTIAVMQ
ncbi:MAG: ADP-ribosylglycohydrolase family protein [Clostridia bacterium]|nr:ADP-ribosylglycohydrolase family protein [Clostridia bacterium]